MSDEEYGYARPDDDYLANCPTNLPDLPGRRAYQADIDARQIAEGVAALSVEGKSAQEIGWAMGISERSVTRIRSKIRTVAAAA